MSLLKALKLPHPAPVPAHARAVPPVPPATAAAAAAGAATKPAPAAPKVARPSLTFNDNPEHEFGKWGEGSYLKGSFKVKGNLKFELAAGNEGVGASEGYTTNQGVKGDVELAKNKGRELFSSLRIAEDKLTLNHEVSAKQVKLSVQGKVTFQSRVPWLAPLLVAEFTVASIDWEKLRQNPDSYTVGAVEFGSGVKGSGTIPIRPGLDAKLTVEVVLAGNVKLNWEKILLEVAKRYALEYGAVGAESAAVGGTGATGATAVAAAPVAGILGGIVGGLALCAASMHAIEVMGQQGRDSAACAQEGARRLRAYADSFDATVRGGSGPSPEGNRDGEAHLQHLMRIMQTTREDAIEMCKESDQNYKQNAWVALRPKMREAVQEAYNRLHWGGVVNAVMLEYLGDTTNY